MNEPLRKNNPFIDHTISERSGVGPNALVEGWQGVLSNLLDQMAPYLKKGRVITFQHLTDEETAVFEKIVSTLDLPECACGVYLPPSVRNQMMYTNQGKDVPVQALMEPDDGAVIFRRYPSGDTIVNALLARPPYTAAADVYNNGALIAGYVYSTVDDCLTSLDDVVKTYFQRCEPIA